jgi:hypothetical protein
MKIREKVVFIILFLIQQSLLSPVSHIQKIKGATSPACPILWICDTVQKNSFLK